MDFWASQCILGVPEWFGGILDEFLGALGRIFGVQVDFEGSWENLGDFGWPQVIWGEFEGFGGSQVKFGGSRWVLGSPWQPLPCRCGAVSDWLIAEGAWPSVAPPSPQRGAATNPNCAPRGGGTKQGWCLDGSRPLCP